MGFFSPWGSHRTLDGGRRAPFLSWSQPDTLLNVFLAIAVDNLANAQELTKVCARGRRLQLGGARGTGAAGRVTRPEPRHP